MGAVEQDMTLNELAVLLLHVMKLYYVLIHLRTGGSRPGRFWF